MKTKTAYRPKSEVPAEIISGPEAVTAPADAAEVQSEPREAAVNVEASDNEAARDYAEQVNEADEATAALKKQFEQLRKSEEFNRQRAEQAAQLQQRPLTRDEKIAQWRGSGDMSEAEEKFLRDNPMMVDADGLTQIAANEAMKQGHTRGTEEFMQTTKRIFDEQLARLQAQAQANAAPQPTPEFFKAPPQPQPRSPERDRAAIVSAPVSREIPTGNPRPEFEQDPRRVTLSVEETEIARASKISEVEYARNKILLQRRKAAGEIV